MSTLRPLAAGCATAFAAFFLAHASGCGTDSVGVDECRDIEYARCEAAQYCGLVDDVAGCKRFYRDQCLHGLASGDRPGSPLIKECVHTINVAGQCAKADVELLTDCLDSEGKPVSQLTVHTTPCDLIKAPEGAKECQFLYKPVVVPEAGPDADAEAATTDDASDGAVDASSD